MRKEALIGAHVSASGGLFKAIDNAVALGVRAIQIFGSSPMQWKASLPAPAAAEKFKEARAREGIEKVYLHAPYLINLASEKLSIRHLSRVLLADTLRISNAIGADGVIYHTGSAGTQSQEDALHIATDAVRRVLADVPEGMLLVENAAGAGALIGDTLEELAYMVKEVGDKRFCMCLDTCHALASGMIESFDSTSVQNLEREIKKKIGEHKLQAVHLNDSKFPYNSKRDRHENIGEGHIGKEGFKNFLANELFAGCPLILEVPGYDGGGPDRKNIETVHSLLK